MFTFLIIPKIKEKGVWCYSIKMCVLHVFILGLLIQGTISKNCTKTFECGEMNGDFADPCHCRRYYTCTNELATRRICPSGLHWDDERLYCTFKHEAKCGPIERKKKPDKTLLPTCDTNECQLPFCYCSQNGDQSPVPSKASGQHPQIVAMTFDGAINVNNFHLYQEILSITKNNETGECPVRGTFFVTHNYNNYQMVEYFYWKGNEIAVSSVTGKSLEFANETEWRNEITIMRDLLKEFGNIPIEDILGARAPQLRPGNDEQFKVLVEEGFIWDSSISTKATDLPIWPYTLDYRIPHVCKIKSCPTKAYPGFWEIPANLHYIEDQSGGACSYVDQCVFAHFNEEDVLRWLKKDFLRFYESNRAPYTLPFHTNWFTHPHQVTALKKFIQWTLQQPQVYYLTATEVLIWMTEPTLDTLQQLTTQCDDFGRAPVCRNPNTCDVPHEDNGILDTRYMTTCNDCPEKYPWVPQQPKTN